MYNPVPLFVGLRYTRAKRRNNFISFISAISILGIALGVWAVITVISTMNGFERELRDRIIGVASHVTVRGTGDWLTGWQDLNRQLSGRDDVVASAPFITGHGMLTHGRQVGGALIRGIEPAQEKQVAQEIAQHIVQGTLNALTSRGYGIVLGRDLARALGAYMGSKITVIVPQGQVTPAGLLPRLKRFTVVGIFDINMYEYDSALALIHLEDAMRLYRADGRVSGIRLMIDNVAKAPLLRINLNQTLGPEYNVRDWTLEHANFFKALEIEKGVMRIILFFILVVAAFNIISTLIMVVTDKQADIAILRTLGMTPISVMGVFMVQGTFIGAVGTVVGGVTGVLTALNMETLVPFVENLFNIEFFPSNIYVISNFPAELRWSDVTQFTVISFSISVLSTLYPAWRASRTQPAEALRYE